jgi:uncharacterized protein (TIGR02646 family)
MKLIYRTPLNPNFLTQYNPNTDKWAVKEPCTPSSDHRNQIWIALLSIQGGVCAYCEAGLQNGRHIEHFANRNKRPDLTFEWTNLFGSCNRNDCCGHYKDSSHNPFSGYNLADLIKPDSEDPWHFLVFGSDGRVSVRDGLSMTDKIRGQTTIDIFNLNAPHHVPERLSKYYCVQGHLALIEEDAEEEIVDLILDEIRSSVLPHLDTYSSAALQPLKLLLGPEIFPTP